MNIVAIPEINYKRDVAGCIDELRNEEFVHFAGLSLKYLAGEIGINELKTSMVIKVMDIKNTRGLDKFDSDTGSYIADNINRIGKLLDFLLVEGTDGKFTYNLDFRRNFVPKIRIGLWLFVGPDAGLTNLNFLQYKDANAAHRQFNETREEKDLDTLIAILYLPWWRKFYKGHPTEKQVGLMARVPMEVKWAIFLFYTACEEFLRTGTIKIDGEEINLDVLYKETIEELKAAKKTKYKQKGGLASVALGLAGTGVFGPIEKVYRQNLYDVLLMLVKQRIEYLNTIDN